tara:strand:- start:29753 stop:30919 length:1167 start_codon:yes stop_codon:yes gene_type:complete
MNDTINKGRLISVEEAAQALCGDVSLLETPLMMDVGRRILAIRSNSRTLLDSLRRYFAAYLAPDGVPDIEVLAIEGTPPAMSLNFIDWAREPGKTGRKDSYVDLLGGRLLRKVRTGMVFLQSDTWRIAAGPCEANDNQVINFINAQYMNDLQRHDWLICHAAGLVRGERAVAIAGFSGGGKSTVMLRAMEHPSLDYLTNDRLFIRGDEQGVQAAGIPKLPRINPGTIVHSERLSPLVSAAQREHWLAMPRQALWDLEEKYDVMIDELYGAERMRREARLAAVVILNWRRDGRQPLRCERVDLNQRPELLDALMKSPGPFYQDAHGRFLSDQVPLDPEPYLAALGEVPVYEVSGTVDFDLLADHHLPALLGLKGDESPERAEREEGRAP